MPVSIPGLSIRIIYPDYLSELLTWITYHDYSNNMEDGIQVFITILVEAVSNYLSNSDNVS
ncbi:MAG: hypothetical protein EOO89_32655 [Pedobacter sp.]|nr:MAG: hypothetical protein EOO89_32655 [Pedobacter sp.]